MSKQILLGIVLLRNICFTSVFKVTLHSIDITCTSQFAMNQQMLSSYADPAHSLEIIRTENDLKLKEG